MLVKGATGNETMLFRESWVNTLRLSQNGRHFPDNLLKCIFLKENVWIVIKISLKIVPEGPVNNIPALVEIMAWRRPGDKPLSEQMMGCLLMHIGVTRPRWVNNHSCWCPGPLYQQVISATVQTKWNKHIFFFCHKKFNYLNFLSVETD